ncbi:MAG: hypothetical protein V4642_06050 [Bacteroidota bacterium]
MKNFICFIVVMLSVTINSCTDSGVNTTYAPFEGTVYYNSVGYKDVWSVNSGGIKEIATNGRITSPPVSNTLLHLRYGTSGVNSLEIFNTEGMNPKSLVNSNSLLASLSPSGTKIVYFNPDPSDYKKTNFSVMNIDGSDKRIIDATAPQQNFLFSPDGSKIAYFKGESGDSLYIVNIDGTNAVFLIQERFINSFDWSPDGEKIAYTNKMGKIGVANINTKENLTLSEDATEKRFIKWLSDSKKIVYVYGNTVNRTKLHIQMLDTESNKTENLVSSDKHLFAPQISPNGKSLLYLESKVLHLDGALKILNLSDLQTITIAENAFIGFWQK